MAKIAQLSDSSDILSLYVEFASQLEELSDLVRHDKAVAARLKVFAGEIRQDVESGTVLRGACRVGAGGQDAEE